MTRNHGGCFQGSKRTLGVYIKLSDRGDGVVFDLDAERMFSPQGIDIQDASPKGIVPYFLHRLFPVVTQIGEPGENRFQIHGLAGFELNQVFAENGWRNHLIQKRLGRGHHHTLTPGGQVSQGFEPGRSHPGIVGLGLIRIGLMLGKKMNRLGEKDFQIGSKGICAFLAQGHDQNRPPGTAPDFRDQERL